MPITVRCLPPEVKKIAINTVVVNLKDEEMICEN